MGFVYALELPSVSAPDVKTRLVKVSINGSENTTRLSFVETRVMLPAIKDGTEVEVSIKEISDTGNESDWGNVYSFTANGSIPSPESGQPLVKLINASPDAVAAAPVPPPEPEPAPVEESPPVNVINGDATVSAVGGND
jgi:hypothetical protein